MDAHDAGEDTGRGRPSMHYTGAEGAEGLGGALARLARQLQQDSSSQAVMDHIVSAAAVLVPGAQEATISLVHRRRHVVSAASSSPLAAAFDQLQNTTGQGPCVDAMYDHRTLRVDDLASEHERWPQLAASADAGATPMRSMLCFQLFVHGGDLGALNVTSAQPGAFNDESEEVGLLFASHAAIAMADARQIEGLNLALDRRNLIGQAQGVLMERSRLTAQQAFAVLARASQDTNRKLHQVAYDLTRTGSLELPPGPR